MSQADASSGTRPLAVFQWRREVLEPIGFHCHIVIGKGHDVGSGFLHRRVQGVRLALLWFEQVTETAKIAVAKLLCHLACLIV